MIAAHCCDTMRRQLADGDVAIVPISKFREYGIGLLDGTPAFQLITYCPWCGTKLPSSLRDEWFDSVEGLGFEAGDKRIPVEFLSDAWWKGEQS
jgi:uncharacterized protein DUF6980